MRSVILYIAASIDNFIAKPDGNVDWLHDPSYELPDEDYGYKEFYDSIDTTLMGNKTYQVLLGFDVPFPYPDKKNYIFTRKEDYEDTEFVRFFSGDVVEFVRSLKQEPGKDIWLIGGGQINTLLLRAGLIDQIHLTMVPVVLGDGIRLFEGTSIFSQFELKQSLTYPSGLVQLQYQKKKVWIVDLIFSNPYS